MNLSIQLRAPAETLSLPLVEVPALVVRLIEAGRTKEAAALNDRWFVAHANAAGHREWVLRPE